MSAHPDPVPPTPLDPPGPLDRAGNERRSADYMHALLADAASLWLPFSGEQPLLCGPEAAPRLAWRTFGARPPGAEAWPTVFLGLEPAGGRAVFAARAPDDARPGDGQRFAPLRPALLALPQGEAAIAAQAAALLSWRDGTRFCSHCGTSLEAAPSGLVMRCPGCSRQHFARTDPAVIMLVTHRDARGVERALLARSPRFGERRVLSTLAGFVEPGERLEDAVRREVREEVGLVVGPPRYVASQPWPFPAQLMLGFTVTAADPHLTIDPEEIIEACWLTREEIRSERDATGAPFHLPGPVSIARRLIGDWLELG